MAVTARCTELGICCDFEATGETWPDALNAIISHIGETHTDDWYELEEFLATAKELLQAKAA